MKKNIHNKHTGLIVFAFFSVLWSGLCLSFLIPRFRLYYFASAEKYAAYLDKMLTPQEIGSIITRCSLLGFAFYFFLLFLLIMEKYIIEKKEVKNLKIFFISVITILAVAIRIAGFSYKTVDYLTQSEWVTFLRENGHFSGFGKFPGNYNAIYLYFLGILSYLPQSMELHLMKLISCAFDFICAFFAMKIIYLMTQSKKAGLITYAVILFSPTVFINSGLWAQCESMYAAFLLISFYYLLKNNIRFAMIMFGIGLSFKLQAIFPLPFVIFFFVYKKISFKHFMFIIIGFFIVSIPAWLFGWPLIRWFHNYFSGTNNVGSLTMNTPTIFTWGYIPYIMPVIFIAAVLFCIGFLIISRPSMPSKNTLLLLFLFCNTAIPFFLPNMHERYFFVGEIAVLLYSVVNPKRFWISLAVIMPALATYSGYLWGTNPFSLVHLSGIMLLAIIFISKWLIESILEDQKLNRTRVVPGETD